MASVHSPFRTFIKPLLFKILKKRGYLYMQYLAKVKDIKNKLVEEKEMALLPNLIKQGDEAFDIGANYAYYSVRLSGLVGPSGKVFAFEPIPFTYKVCKKVLNHFKSDNVALYEKGVGQRNEKIEFSVPQVDFGAISAGQAHFSNRNNEIEGKENFYKFNRHQNFVCDVVKLDDFLGKELKNLSFIKIDIEGAEYFALQGMQNIIHKFKPVILIEISPYFLKGFNISEDQLLKLLKNDFGYQVFYLEEGKSKLKKLDDSQKVWESNFILIHSSKENNYKNIMEI